MKNCLFCQIIAGEINVPLVYEDEKMLAFNDISPQAPHHVLIIPRQHIATLNDIGSQDISLLGEMIYAAKKIAAEKQISSTGYRLLFNCNSEGGQSVFHLHLHLLGGRQMNWPPG